MNETNRYIDRVRQLTDTGTDYAVAKFLGVTETSINKYRRGHRTIDDDAALRVARALNINVAEVIAARNIDRAATEEQREEWRKELKHYANSVASALLFGLVISAGSGAETYAQVGTENSDCGSTATRNHNHCTNYTQCLGRWLRVCALELIDWSRGLRARYARPNREAELYHRGSLNFGASPAH